MGCPVSLDVKVCPRCAEEVRAAADVCRFCGHDFTVTPSAAALRRSDNVVMAMLAIVAVLTLIAAVIAAGSGVSASGSSCGSVFAPTDPGGLFGSLDCERAVDSRRALALLLGFVGLVCGVGAAAWWAFTRRTER